MYHEKARAEIQDYASRMEEAKAQETEVREELQDCLVKIDNAEKEIDSLLNDMETMKDELDGKTQALDDLQDKHEKLNETFKANTSAKARDHQHMRDKKKWIASEKQLREELAQVKKQFNQIQEEHKVVKNERDGLDEAFRQIEEENTYYKTEIKTMEDSIDEFSKAELEYMRRTESLEQELVRLQNNSSRPSPARVQDSEQVEGMRIALQSKDKEIERIQRMAEDAINEVNTMKTRSGHPSPNATPRITNSSPTFDAFNTDDDEVKRLTSSLAASPSHGEWDEMDNSSLSQRKKASMERPPSPVQFREKAGTPDLVKQERRAIENDAIRSYMRHRRRQKRHS